VTANTVPAGDTYSLIVVPEGAWISCTVYFAAGTMRAEAFMDTRSDSVEFECSPRVADAKLGSTSITAAMLARIKIEIALRILICVMIPGSENILAARV
jgi:hypothetical protein